MASTGRLAIQDVVGSAWAKKADRVASDMASSCEGFGEVRSANLRKRVSVPEVKTSPSGRGGGVPVPVPKTMADCRRAVQRRPSSSVNWRVACSIIERTVGQETCQGNGIALRGTHLPLHFVGSAPRM